MASESIRVEVGAWLTILRQALIKIYLREIMQTPLLTPQQEIELAARNKTGDQKARAWMIKANLRLVVKIAHDYSNLGLPPPRFDF